MKLTYIIIPCTLFLISCSFNTQNPPEEIKVPPVSLSGNTSITGSQDGTGSIQNPPNIQTMSVGADETKDTTLRLNDNKGTLKINYGTGARVKVNFKSEDIKTLKVNLQTPGATNGNIRITQIIFPDGTSDGPFGRDLTYSLTQSGAYQIILSANMMAGDRWGGEVDMYLELQ